MNGLLAVLWWWSSSAGISCSRVRGDFPCFESAIKMYMISHGRPPLAEYGLRSLVERTPDHIGDPRWTKLMTKVPPDPWQNPYRYIVSPDLPGGYGIYSTGVDGVSLTVGNDPDDYNSWNPGKHQIEPSLADHGGAIFAIAFGSCCFGAAIGWSLRPPLVRREKERLPA